LAGIQEDIKDLSHQESAFLSQSVLGIDLVDELDDPGIDPFGIGPGQGNLGDDIRLKPDQNLKNQSANGPQWAQAGAQFLPPESLEDETGKVAATINQLCRSFIRGEKSMRQAGLCAVKRIDCIDVKANILITYVWKGSSAGVKKGSRGGVSGGS
jgi:hypothetical protein